MERSPYDLPLSATDQIQYLKLFASSEDVSIALECANHIRKNGLFRYPWSRGQIYFRQSAFVTTLIVSYCRPFSIGKQGVAFPAKLIRDYDEQQKTLHNTLLTYRNTIYAHSDLGDRFARPMRANNFVATTSHSPILRLETSEIDIFVAMSKGLIHRIHLKMAEIRDKY
jgi:hypothetical protein